eukprot:TRINITY_DN10723_c0_g1_i2.p1 TRINITY_DN10723_c0_g1~~TRINITY_DN10723_c0_g1_i2.p1  ORF type:complete len:265 (+),score=91.81 TRINITY_DN10723_c0_g1_i2:171-965(+)
MNDSNKGSRCPTCTRVIKVLKELEGTYRELAKDKEVLVKFVQFVFPEKFHSELSLDVPVGSLELAPLQELYKVLLLLEEEDARLKQTFELGITQLEERLKGSEEENKRLQEQVKGLKLVNAELREKEKNMEKKQRNDASDKGLIDANLLLVRMKRTNLGSKLTTERNEEFQKRLNEKNEIILKLKVELNSVHALLVKHNAAACVTKESRESQTEKAERGYQEIQTEGESVEQTSEYETLKESLMVLLLAKVVRQKPVGQTCRGN